MQRNLLAVALLSVCAAFAQPVIQNVVVVPSYGTALVRLQIAGVPAGQPTYSVKYGPSTSLGFENVPRSTWPTSLPSTAVFQAQPVGALQARTIYFFRPVVSISGQTSSWDCNTAPGGVTTPVAGAQVGCDAASGVGWFRTLDLPNGLENGADVIPPDISSLPVVPPSPTLPPLKVAAGDAADLAAKIAACAANTGGSDVQEVLLPAGSVYTVSLNLPVKSGDGMCILRTEEVSMLPPDGVRVSAAHAAVMATIQAPLRKSGQVDFSGAINAPNGTRGWYFLGIRFTFEPPLSSTPQTEYTITKVNDTGDEITVSPPHNYSFNTYLTVQVYGVEGRWESPKGPNGVFNLTAFAGTDKLRVGRNPLVCSSPPCYESGGKVRIAVASQVCGATNANPIVITTCNEHGITNDAAIPMAAHPANFPVIPSWANLPGDPGTYRVLIEGSSVAANNGQWTLHKGRRAVSDAASDRITLADHGFANGDQIAFWVAQGDYYPGLPYQGPYYVVNATQSAFQLSSSANGEPLQLNNGGTDGKLWVYLQPSATRVDVSGIQACAADCGTLRTLQPIHIKGVDGNTAANGSAYMKVLSPTTLELLEKQGNGEYTSGGVIAHEPTHWVSLVSIGGASSRVHIDRCLFQGGWPTRVSAALTHAASESSIINNYFDDVQFFRHIRPVTNARTHGLDSWGLGANPYYIATTDGIDTTSGHTKLFENNYIEAHGITLYSQEAPSAPPFENGVIRRNTFVVSEAKRAGSPSSDGLYYPHRHHLEWKRGTRFLVDGNRFVGGWIDYNACGPTVLMSPRGGDAIGDITFTNNTIQGGTTGIYWMGVDDRSTSTTPLVGRLRFHNNVITDMDGYRKSVPWDGAVNPAHCGYPLYLNGGSESVVVTHNLLRWSRGDRTSTFAFYNGKGSGLTIKNNILWYTNDENMGPLWPAAYVWTYSGTPNPTGNQRQVFDTLWSHSVFANNVVVPGPRSTKDLAKFDSRSGQDTLFSSDCTNYFTGFQNVFCVGKPSGGDSANERMGMLRFQAPEKGNFRLRTDSPAASGSLVGVDGQQRAAAQHLSSDAKDVGPDHDALESAQGLVQNLHTTDVENDRATLVYIAPDTNACSVDYATQPFPVPEVNVTRVSDGGGERTRKVQLTELAPATTYYYQVLCATEQPAGTFQTR